VAEEEGEEEDGFGETLVVSYRGKRPREEDQEER